MLLRPGPAARSAWLGYWLLLFVLTHIPTAPPVSTIPHSDRILHAVAYFVLTFLGGWAAGALGPPRTHADGQAAPPPERGPVTMRYLGIWALVYVGYAALDEALQPLTGRTMSFGDWIADLVGIAAATAILMVNRRKEPSAPEGEQDPVT